MMNDTSTKAEAAQLHALRLMSPARRLGLALGWSRSVREMSRAGLMRQHPDCSEADLNRLLADRLLGPELALKVYGDQKTHG